MSNVNIFSLKNDNVLDDKSHSISGNTPYLSTKNTSFSAVNYSTFFDGIQNIFHVVKNCCRIATMEDLYLIFGCRNSFWLFMNYFIGFRVLETQNFSNQTDFWFYFPIKDRPWIIANARNDRYVKGQFGLQFHSTKQV